MQPKRQLMLWTHSSRAGISFNGTNAEITLTSDSDVNPGSGVFTLGVTPMPHLEGNAELVFTMARPAATGLFVLRRVGAGTLMVERHNTAFDITGAAFSEDTWHHVAVTRDSSNNVRLFVDGNQSGSTSNNTHNYQGTFRLGRTNNIYKRLHFQPAFNQGNLSLYKQLYRSDWKPDECN